MNAAIEVMKDEFVFDDLPKSKLTDKPVLHFVHANGVPSPTYEVLFSVWKRFFSIEKIDYLGMDFRYQVDDNWQSLSYQVLDSIQDACDKHGVSELVAVGHSVGAVTSLQALYKDARHIKAVALLDPAILLGLRSFSWFVAKQLDRLPKIDHRLIDKMSPAGKSKYRKESFTSREEAYDKLRHKGLFKLFDERCFLAYLEHGFMDDVGDDGNKNGGVRLAISRATEVAIFRHMPMSYWYHTPSLPKPVTIIAGKDSYFEAIGSYRLASKKLGIAIEYQKGTHMFPLEYPEDTAQKVLKVLSKQLKST